MTRDDNNAYLSKSERERLSEEMTDAFYNEGNDANINWDDHMASLTVSDFEFTTDEGETIKLDGDVTFKVSGSKGYFNPLDACDYEEPEYILSDACFDLVAVFGNEEDYYVH